MTTDISEQHVRAGLSKLLSRAVQNSGRPRYQIAQDAQMHKDALRRVLKSERSPTVSEAMRVLNAAGAAPHAHMLLYIVAGGERSSEWLHADLALFFDELIRELPTALEQQLGERLHDIKPGWAKGTAQRMARLLFEHIEELARKDAFFGDIYGDERETSHA